VAQTLISDVCTQRSWTGLEWCRVLASALLDHCEGPDGIHGKQNVSLREIADAWLVESAPTPHCEYRTIGNCCCGPKEEALLCYYSHKHFALQEALYV